jgi:hypothetical protein
MIEAELRPDVGGELLAACQADACGGQRLRPRGAQEGAQHRTDDGHDADGHAHNNRVSAHVHAPWSRQRCDVLPA